MKRQNVKKNKAIYLFIFLFEYLILKALFYKYLPCFVSLVPLFLSMIA